MEAINNYPNFKKSSPSDSANYRPITITCTCCKVLETIIASDLVQFLQDHNLISKHQHVFLKKHSTTTNLLESVNDWTLSLSTNKSVVIAYIDFKRAFDSVPHSKLIHKLASYGIHGNLLFWISSFFSDRLQNVRVGASLSSPCQVTSGVPQGSVIGPLLFNLFINDITDNLDSSTTSKIFADDIKIYTEISCNNQSTNLQNHLDLIHQWSTTWQLPISHSKCNLLYLGQQKANLSFSISNTLLPELSSVVDLGVTIDPDLKFSDHISSIVTRAKQRAALVHRCFISRNISNLVMAFKIYVRPLVEYAPQIWSPHHISLINLVEGVQRSFTKRLPGFKHFSYAERLSHLQLQSLEQRRLVSDLTMCFNIVHGFSSLSFDDFFKFSSCSITRGHPLKLAPPLCKTNLRKFFFSSRVIQVWNSLPVKIVMSTSTFQFKKLLSVHDYSVFLTLPCFIPRISSV